MKPTIFFAMISPPSSGAAASAGSCEFKRQGWLPALLVPVSRHRQQRGAERESRAGSEAQTFSTCEKSSSTGVARPKIVTDTRTLDLS